MEKAPVDICVLSTTHDQAHCEALSTHLFPLVHQKLASLDIGQPGEDREQRLRGREVILILVTPRLVGSESNLRLVELALQQREAGARVIPILVSKTVQGLAIQDLVSLPRNGRALSEWPKEQADSAWVEVAEAVQAVVEQLLREGTRRTRATPDPAPPVAAAPARIPTRPSLFKVLSEVLINDIDVDGFARVYFPEVYKRYFARGMTPMEKIVHLLDYTSPGELLRRMRESHAARVAALESLFEYE